MEQLALHISLISVLIVASLAWFELYTGVCFSGKLLTTTQFFMEIFMHISTVCIYIFIFFLWIIGSESINECDVIGLKSSNSK